jgi:hypothetical protein
MQALSTEANFYFLQIISSYGAFVKCRTLRRVFTIKEDELLSSEKYYRSLKHSFLENYPNENNLMLDLLKDYQEKNENLNRQKHKIFNQLVGSYRPLWVFLKDLNQKLTFGCFFRKQDDDLIVFLQNTLTKNQKDKFLTFDCNEKSLKNMEELIKYTKNTILNIDPQIVIKEVDVIKKNDVDIHHLESNNCFNKIEELKQSIVDFEKTKNNL